MRKKRHEKKNQKKQSNKVIAIAITLFIIISSLSGAFIMSINHASANNDKTENRQIAADISNMTGVPIEEILTLKSEDISWNDVLEQIKQRPSTQMNAKLYTDLSDDFIAQLKNEGFKKDKIDQAKQLVDIVIFQLEEITNYQSQNIIDKVGDVTGYSEILNKINIQDAIRVVLSLSDRLGSMEQALDEYLYCLQADLDPLEMLFDMDRYMERKNQAMLKHVITLSSIEQKLIETIQAYSNKNTDDESQSNDVPVPIEPPNSNNSMVQIPIPTIEESKPDNPLDDILNEINVIDPMKEQ